MTRIEMLTKKITVIYKKRFAQINSLPTEGPKGGKNAKYIKGWKRTGNHVITKACIAANLPILDYWKGHLPTPSKAIPECILEEVKTEYEKIFGKKA